MCLLVVDYLVDCSLVVHLMAEVEARGEWDFVAYKQDSIKPIHCAKNYKNKLPKNVVKNTKKKNKNS